MSHLGETNQISATRQRTGRAAAIVGAGPAGLYALAALLKSESFTQIDVFEAAPAPYGLIRYGVAPDHPKTRNIARLLAKGLQASTVRFLGNVAVGRDLSVAELRAAYDAVIVSTGQPGDRKLGIPGEELDGSLGASELVAWYTGHPDGRPLTLPPDLRTAVVIGAGNVALDVARVLVKDEAALRTTSMPRHVVDTLAASTLTDVHVVARRGPAQAKFTSPELHEIGGLDDVDVIVDETGLELSADDEQIVETERRARVIVGLCNEWAQRPTGDTPRHVHFHFWRRPTRLAGDTRVTAVELESTRPSDQAPATLTLDAQLVVRAIGYHGRAIAGLPFDEATGTVPSTDGRVVTDQGVAPGIYVTGWLRRGPSGVIATNRADAEEVAASVTADLPSLPLPDSNPSDVEKLLVARKSRVIDWADWLRLEAHEKAQGERHGSDPIVVHDLKAVLELLNSSAA